MIASIGQFSASDRLYVHCVERKFLVDTGSPNMIVFKNKVLTLEQANNLPVNTRFDEMLALRNKRFKVQTCTTLAIG